MSAFGVVMVGLGIMCVWASMKNQKVNVILKSVFAPTPAKKKP